MHTNDPKLSKEIDGIIDKYNILDDLSKPTNEDSENFFSELSNAINRSKNEVYNKINRKIRKNKIKKIIDNNENNS